jgi:hypothetical protein
MQAGDSMDHRDPDSHSTCINRRIEGALDRIRQDWDDHDAEGNVGDDFVSREYYYGVNQVSRYILVGPHRRRNTHAYHNELSILSPLLLATLLLTVLADRHRRLRIWTCTQCGDTPVSSLNRSVRSVPLLQLLHHAYTAHHTVGHSAK